MKAYCWLTVWIAALVAAVYWNLFCVIVSGYAIVAGGLVVVVVVVGYVRYHGMNRVVVLSQMGVGETMSIYG